MPSMRALKNCIRAGMPVHARWRIAAGLTQPRCLTPVRSLRSKQRNFSTQCVPCKYSTGSLYRSLSGSGQVMCKTDGERHQRKSRVGGGCGREHGIGADVEILDVMHAKVRIDDTIGG